MKRFKGCFSSFILKTIAIICMILDHFNSIIILDGIYAPYRNAEGNILFTADMPFYFKMIPTISTICRILGDIAFPIFCFLIVQGFIHTKSKCKYIIRLGIFALISEIPYDLVHYNKIFDFKLQNVLFTLFVGFCTLIILEKIFKYFKDKKNKKILLVIFTIIVGMGLAFLIKGEYVFLGVLTISLMYILRERRFLKLISFIPLGIALPWSLLSVLPISLYNGQKGKGLKYFFYVFYPTHFLLFAYITNILSNRKI